MLECAIHPITYRGEGILATVVKGMATIRHIRIDQCHILCVDDKGNITLMMDSIHTIHFTSGVDDQYFRWSDPSGSLCFADLFNAALFGGEQVLKLPSDLGLVIGAITESQQLINHALESEQKGGQVNMCNALEELKLEGRLEGRLEGKQEGIEEGILANIRTCKNFNISKEDTIRNLMKEFSLSEPEAVSYMKKYW